jgi:hypothetical protein
VENKFESIVLDQIKDLDEILSSWGTPIAQRPFQLADLFVKECILEIRGDTLDDYHGKWYFAEIYNSAEKWYRERFPEEFDRKDDSCATAVVEMHGVPFELRVPLSFSEPGEKRGTIWLVFPKEILPQENPTTWLVSAPSKDAVSEAEWIKWVTAAQEIAGRVRSIRNSLGNAESHTVSVKPLCASVFYHLEAAAKGILEGSFARIATSYWESHIAVEKVLKVLLGQNGIGHENSHDLDRLFELANRAPSGSFSVPELQAMPDWRVAIRCRYCEEPTASRRGAMEVYFAALKIVARVANELQYGIVMNNARILIQAPPWVRRHKRIVEFADRDGEGS